MKSIRSVPARFAVGAVALGLALVLTLTACTGDTPEGPAPGPRTSSSSAPTLTVDAGPLTVQLDSVRGRLRDPAGVRSRLRRVIGRWMSASFLGPGRTDFAPAFAAYTPVAAEQARRQQTVTTNASLGPELVEVVPTRRNARVAVFAAGGRGVGASAEVLLVLVGAREDSSQLELVVQGDLELTPTANGWKVFGFDLARSVGAPGSYAAQLKQRREQPAQPGGKRPGGGSR